MVVVIVRLLLDAILGRCVCDPFHGSVVLLGAWQMGVVLGLKFQWNGMIASLVAAG